MLTILPGVRVCAPSTRARVCRITWRPCFVTATMVAASLSTRRRRVDDLVVFERLVHFPEPGLHEPLGLRQDEAKQHHLRQLELDMSRRTMPLLIMVRLTCRSPERVFFDRPSP